MCKQWEAGSNGDLERESQEGGGEGSLASRFHSSCIRNCIYREIWPTDARASANANKSVRHKTRTVLPPYLAAARAEQLVASESRLESQLKIIARQPHLRSSIRAH